MSSGRLIIVRNIAKTNVNAVLRVRACETLPNIGGLEVGHDQVRTYAMGVLPQSELKRSSICRLDLHDSSPFQIWP